MKTDLEDIDMSDELTKEHSEYQDRSYGLLIHEALVGAKLVRFCDLVYDVEYTNPELARNKDSSAPCLKFYGYHQIEETEYEFTYQDIIDYIRRGELVFLVVSHLYVGDA